MNRHLASRKQEQTVWDHHKSSSKQYFKKFQNQHPSLPAYDPYYDQDVIMKDVVKEAEKGNMVKAVDKLGHYLQNKYSEPNPYE